ncbi:hypothetical protein PG994_012435 [Apiospora phragmitis]|uniref:Uncharacterized protein n=1 Tax=Apiospora phragmitis TaxID=2905665 RepID=A0ABR1TXX0_9PEZI
MFVAAALETLTIEPPQCLVEVTDICSTLNRNTTSAIEIQLDTDGSFGYHSRCAGESPALEKKGEALDVLLPKLKLHMGAMMEFYTLMINMITTPVQLGGTPWLRKPWNKKNIMFFEVKGNGADKIDVLHPYLVNHHPEGELHRTVLTARAYPLS